MVCGPLKKEVCELTAGVRREQDKGNEEKFTFRVTQRAVGGTAKDVAAHVPVQKIHRKPPHEAGPGAIAAPDDADLSD